MELFGYKAVPLREDHELILYRGHAKEVTAPSVLLLATVSPRPALETVEKLQHEYSFRNELDTTWTVRPMTLSQNNEQSVLVFEDPRGEPLTPQCRFATIKRSQQGNVHCSHRRRTFSRLIRSEPLKNSSRIPRVRRLHKPSYMKKLLPRRCSCLFLLR